MFKVLVAAADKEIRKRIREYINSSAYGFKVTGEAENGKQVLESLEREPADLVISELRLPGVSGYQLLVKLQHSFPATRLILYADYGELELLKKAEADGLLAYLLKPVKPQDMERVLYSARHVLEELNKKNNEEKKLISKYEQTLPVFQDRFLINLVHGHLEDDRDISSGFRYFNLSLVPAYTVMVLKIDYFNKLSLVFDEREKEIFIFALSDKIQKYLDGLKNGTAFINNYDEIAVILGSGLSLSECHKIGEAIRQLVRQETVTTVTIGIGMTYERESEIYVSYKQAEAAIRYRYRFGSNAIIHISSVEPGSAITYRYPKKKEELLVAQTIIGNRQAVLKLLEGLRSSLESFGELPDKLLPKLALNILVSVSRYANEQEINLEELFAKHVSVKELSAMKSLDEVFGYLKKVLEYICDHVEKVKKDKDEEILRTVKAYIKEHLARELSPQDIAAAVNVLPEYLDKLVRQEDKLSLADLVLRFRIDEAKRLMADTELDDLAIAVRVGFSDEKFFAGIFHRLEGITVLDYRHGLRPKLYNDIYIQ